MSQINTTEEKTLQPRPNQMTVVRGDTLETNPIQIFYKNEYGEQTEKYIPSASDKLRFACKRNLSQREPLIVKDIPIDTRILRLDAEDTKKFLNPTKPDKVIEYVYDIQLTRADGTVITIIETAPLYVRPEVE